MEETRGPVYRVGAPYTEQLNYSNPLEREVVTVWYNNFRYFVLETDYRVFWTDPPQVPVKEYVFYYPSAANPKRPGEPTDHFPVFSLIPGSYHYQPIAEIVQFVVPRSYDPAQYRSEAAILASDYPIIPTGTYYVRPVL